MQLLIFQKFVDTFTKCRCDSSLNHIDLQQINLTNTKLMGNNQFLHPLSCFALTHVLEFIYTCGSVKILDNGSYREFE